MSDLLDNMSKIDGRFVEVEQGVHFRYSEADVILALIACIRGLNENFQ